MLFVFTTFTVQYNLLTLQLWAETPLYVASKHGHNQIVELLIAAGANVNIVSEVSYQLHINIEKSIDKIM